ncbi:MAG: YraN family protein [Dactylosporangium sp.]|nr:YraN family protein [Dactylosporangium sp.]NNJ63741.1 YraN family protein [Dactylosporangium sp.]
MTRANDAVGAYGERVAVRHLLNQGMELLERNWRGTIGEIDIIAQDGDALVFCEVKTRRSERFGQPVEAVRPAKARRIRHLAAQWLAGRGVGRSQVRFDVVSVRPQPSGPARVEHLRGAF